MKRVLFFLVSIAAILFISCSDSTDLNGEDFSLTLSVKDSLGNPVPDLNVNVCNNVPCFNFGGRSTSSENRACTTIPFSMDDQAHVQLVVYDIEHRHVKTLVDEEICGGHHCVCWNGKDDNNELCKPGVYYYKMKVTSEDNVIYEDEKLMYLFDIDSEKYAIGQTDSNGSFICTDKILFPNLYDIPEIEAVDEDGNYLGTFTVPDSVRITLTNTITDEKQYIDSEITYCNNQVNIIWEPQTHPDESRKTINTKTHDNVRDTDGDIVAETKLMGNYPNPFN